MRGRGGRLVATLVLALSAIGCGLARPNANFGQDLNDLRECLPDRFITGELVADPSVAIRDDRNEIIGVTWPSSFSLRWTAGFPNGRFDVLDDTGAVVATVGHRYRFAGITFSGNGTFWACSDITPQ
jgi:hypothetical protein